MLDIAYRHKDKLQKKYQSTLLDDKYKFWRLHPWYRYNLEIEEDSWNSLAFVSLDSNGDILGYMEGAINRGNDSVHSILVMNFGSPCITFSRDVYKFMDHLLTRFRKVSFSVVVGNPAEQMYDRYTKKKNGRIVGTQRNEVRLRDGKYYDLKLYEIESEAVK